MKQLLSVLGLAMVLVSCEKKMPTVEPASSVSLDNAYNNMRLTTNGFYHLSINRQGIMDSSVCIRFVNSKSFTEYKTYTDTNGLHLLDSTPVTAVNYYAEYLAAQPSDYNTTVGYYKIKYFPVGGTVSGFAIHDYLVADTMLLGIGVPTANSQAYINFLGARADSPKVRITIYQ